MFIKVVLLAVTFDPLAGDTFALPKSAASHAATYVLVALLVWYVTAVGLRSIPFAASHWGAAAVVIAFALAVPFAVDQTVALYGVSRRYLGLTHILDGAVLYLAATVAFRERNACRRLLVVALATSLPVDAYAFVQLAGRDPITYLEGSTRPAISTLGQPDILAGYVSIIASTALGICALEWRHLSRTARALLIGAGLLALVVLFSNAIRGGLLGLAGGSLGVLAVLLARPAAHRGRVLGGAVVAATAIIAAVLVSPMRDRLSLAAIGNSLEIRFDIWDTAITAVRTHPVLGLGPDNFAAVYPALHSERSVALQNNLLQNSTHDWLLYVATSAGLVGTIAVVVFLAMALRSGLRLARASDFAALAVVPLLAYLGQGLVNVNDVSLDWTMWITAGVIAARSRSDWPIPVRSKGMGAPAAAVVGVALLVVAGAMAVGAVGRIRGSEASGASRDLVAAGRGLEAVQEARTAISADDRRAEYWSAFGAALASAGNANAAETAFRDAIVRQPWQPLYWRNIAILRLQRNDTPGAHDALEQTLKLDPYDADSHDLLSRITYADGRFEEAAAEGALTVRLVPQRAAVYEVPVRANLALGRIDAAGQLVEMGLVRPDIVDVRLLQVLRGEVLFAERRFDEARQQIDQVLQSYPDYPPALSLLQRLNNR